MSMSHSWHACAISVTLSQCYFWHLSKTCLNVIFNVYLWYLPKCYLWHCSICQKTARVFPCHLCQIGESLSKTRQNVIFDICQKAAWMWRICDNCKNVIFGIVASVRKLPKRFHAIFVKLVKNLFVTSVKNL